MLGFCDLVGVGIAALSKKLAVKGLLDMRKYVYLRDKKRWIETYLQCEGLCKTINPRPPDIPKNTPAQIPVPIAPMLRW